MLPDVLVSHVDQALTLGLEAQQMEAIGDLGESIFSGGHGLWREEQVK